MKLLMITQKSNSNEAWVRMGQKVQAQHVSMTQSKLCQTQQSALRGRRMSYDNSTISRDLKGAKGSCLACISDTEQIAPISMCLDMH
eukprot:7007321-Ditylum_brightwellii.AAC.1